LEHSSSELSSLASSLLTVNLKTLNYCT